MATVVTTLTPTLRPFPLITPPSRDTERSLIPRRILRGELVDGVVAASGVGDNQQVQIRSDLPQGLAYVLLEATITIKNDAGSDNNFEDRAALLFADATVNASQTSRFRVPILSEGLTTLGDTLLWRIYRPLQLPKSVMIPVPGSQVRTNTLVFNATANDDAMLVDASFAWAEYTIEQANYWPISTAQPTR